MAHPILPRLVKDRVKNFNSTGVWERRGPEELKDVADGIDVPDRNFDAQSIPDVWARPLLFESALLSDLESAQTRLVQGEWRGMLAILGLRRLRGLNGIDFSPIFSDRLSQAGFLYVAEKLRPDRLIDWTDEDQWKRVSISRGTNWRQVSLITYNSKSIGMTSPTTLVCTAAEYGDRIDAQRVPWLKQGRLTDPRDSLAREEQQALAYWLFLIHHDLTAFAKGGKWERLSHQLGRFIQDLGYDENAVKRFKKDFDKAPHGDSLVELGTVINYVEAPTGQCDVELQSFRTQPPRSRALVLEEDAARQWKKAAVAINVLGVLPLSAALNQLNPAKRELIGSMPISGGNWYKKDDFFTPKLHVFTMAGGLPGAVAPAGSLEVRWNEHAVSAITPIRKQWLEWLTAQEIKERVNFTQEGGGIRVNLKLPLTGGELVISHTYNSDSIVDLGDEPPITRIWPFLTDPGWKAYYSYYDNYEVNNARLIPWVEDGEPETRRIKFPDTHDTHRAEISRTKRYPEAMVCDFGGEEAGVLVLDQPKSSPTGGGVWRVGIDFGTTGTSIFYATGSAGENRSLPLQARAKAITESGRWAAMSTRRFLPLLDQDGGALLSIYHDFLVPNSERFEAGQLEPLLEGRIYYVENVDAFDATDGGVFTNMKWGDESDRARGKAFLKQLGMQACAEAASRGATGISWRFSFPTAFSERDLQTFGNFWQQVVERCHELTGVAPVPEQEAGFKRKNESVAAAHYFRKVEDAPMQLGAVCIDIGGGTSDIVIWQKDRIVAQTSFRLAGRDIFLHPIYLRPKLFKIFGRNTVKLEQAKEKNLDEFLFHSQVDVLLKGDNWSQILKQLSTVEANPVIRSFVVLLELGIGGILHYVGLMLRKLAAQGHYERFMPNIYFGGNASKILHWCASGNYQTGTEIDKRFKTLLARATNFTDLAKQLFEIRISRAPKSEVAHGLLLDTKDRTEAPAWDWTAEEETDPPLLAGENYSIGDKPCEWDSYLSKHSDLSKARISRELPQLQALLKNLKMEADPLMLNTCSNAVNNALADAADDVSARHLEPPFVTALKVLLRQKAEVWAELPPSERERV